MRLRYSQTSPYVRKVLVLAAETGLAERLERVPSNPWDPADELPSVNPLGKVPALETDEGLTLTGSQLICEYLDSLHGGTPMLPREGDERWRVLQQQQFADGIMEAAVLWMVEGARRPEPYRWPEWQQRQLGKIERTLDTLEAQAESLEDELTLGQIAIACALGYLDFRLSAFDWRKQRPKLAAWYEAFAARPSMRATLPPAA